MTPDRLMTARECAEWMQLSYREVLVKAVAGQIPCIRLNRRVFRFHAQTILDSLQGRSAKGRSR